MIFHISPKLSVARDLPQTYRQTVMDHLLLLVTPTSYVLQITIFKVR